MPGRDFAQVCEEVHAQGNRSPRGAGWFENDSGELTLPEPIVDERDVALRDADGVAERRVGDAGGLRRIGLSGARADHIVLPAMEVMVELKQLVTSGISTG